MAQREGGGCSRPPSRGCGTGTGASLTGADCACVCVGGALLPSVGSGRWAFEKWVMRSGGQSSQDGICALVGRSTEQKILTLILSKFIFLCK